MHLCTQFDFPLVAQGTLKLSSNAHSRPSLPRLKNKTIAIDDISDCDELEYLSSSSIDYCSRSGSEDDDGEACDVTKRMVNIEGDKNSQLNVLYVKDAIDYVVPSFSVLRAKLTPATVTFGDDSDHVDVYMNSDGDIPNQIPFSVLITEQCSIEVKKINH